MKIKLHILLFLFLASSITLSWGQQKYVAHIESLTTDDGLSHSDVNCFEKDDRGILWVGTRNGLNRFDGKKFKIFTKESGLNHNNIFHLYQDKEFLWCVHENRKTHLPLLSIFHTREEKVLSLKEYLGENLLFEQKDIISINKLGTTHQSLVIKTQTKTYTYDSKNGLKELWFIKEKEEVVLASQNGDVWFSDWNLPYLNLRKVNKEGKEIFFSIKKEFPLTRVAFFKKNSGKEFCFAYHLIKKDKSAYLWLFVDVKGELRTEKSFFYSDGKKLSLNNYFCQYIPKHNAKWYITSYGNSLLKGSDSTVLYQGITKFKWKKKAFSILDKNIIWGAEQTNGMLQLEFLKNRFTNIFNKEEGAFRGITQIKNTLYISSHLGLFMINKEGEKYKYHNFESLNSINSLKDKEDNLWVFARRFLIKKDSNLKETDRFELNKHGENYVWSMYQDKNELIWYSNMGLKAFNPKTEKLQEVITNGFSEIEKGIVYHFYEKENGNILLCSTTGLYEMELNKGITARYWSGGKGKYYLPADDFRHLHFDKSNQTYWLASNEKGLIHWNPQTNQSKTYTFNHREANIIHAVYADAFGFLWLSTENGIFQFEKKTGNFKVYSTKEGTSTHEFNRISHFQDKNGKIYFGGIKGVTTFEPKDFYQDFNSTEEVEIIPVEISQFKENAKQIENVTASFYQTKQVDFYPNDRYLTFIFGLTDYRYSREAIYFYKIKGIDKEWIEMKSNDITLSGIPYGEQVLEIKALLPNEKFTKKRLAILVIVHKPFYLQWWFFVFLFLGLLGIILFYIRYRTQNLESQKVVLEQEVKKRTLKIKKDKEVIEKQAKKLIELDKTKTRFFANVSHELRTPITLIKAPIQSVIKSQKLNQRNEYLLNKAAQNTDNLLNLVNEILDLTKLDNKKLYLKEEKVVFYTFIRQLLGNFQSIAEMQKVAMSLEYRADIDLQMLIDKDKYRKVFNNLLSNALKFTRQEGEIVLRVEDLGGEILLKVTDTGRGIPKQDIPYVFDRYFQSSQNAKAEGGLGIGLALSMELVKLCQGKMWLESSTEKENHGTSFFVQFAKKEILNMLSTQDVLAIEKDFSEPKNKKALNKVTFSNKKASKAVLIVEDNNDLREYLSLLLSVDYKVLTAENGKKALDLLLKGEIPNLIISDLMMPIMDGYEFLETVKNNEQLAGIPFIMLTARVGLKDKLKALRIGVDDYITKPFDEDELLVRVKNLLLNYSQRLAYIESEQKATQNLDSTSTTSTTSKLSLKDRKWLEDFENLVIDKINSSLFSVDYLAEIIKINRLTLYKKIKMLTGLTPNQYIRVIRLKVARDILEKQECETIKEVANRVGFKKTGYFTSLFKKEYGKNPLDYLNNLAENK